MGHISGDMPERLKKKVLSNLKAIIEVHGNIEWTEGGETFSALHFSQYMRCSTKVNEYSLEEKVGSHFIGNWSPSPRPPILSQSQGSFSYQPYSVYTSNI